LQRCPFPKNEAIALCQLFGWFRLVLLEIPVAERNRCALIEYGDDAMRQIDSHSCHCNFKDCSPFSFPISFLFLASYSYQFKIVEEPFFSLFTHATGPS